MQSPKSNASLYYFKAEYEDYGCLENLAEFSW